MTNTDSWGDILDRPCNNCAEIRWFDTAAAIWGADSNAFLATFAEAFETCGRTGGLVDAIQSRMDMAKMSVGWRDAQIIPRYNAAGMKRFAFHMLLGMPAIGSDPTAEGPASLPTGYFGTHRHALDWLND